MTSEAGTSAGDGMAGSVRCVGRVIVAMSRVESARWTAVQGHGSGAGAAGDEVGGPGLGVLDNEDIRAIGVTDHFGGDHRLGSAAGHDESIRQQVDGVAEQRGQAQVVQGGEDRDVSPETSSRIST